MLQGSSTRVNTTPRSHPVKISMVIKQLGGERQCSFDGLCGVDLRPRCSFLQNCSFCKKRHFLQKSVLKVNKMATTGNVIREILGHFGRYTYIPLKCVFLHSKFFQCWWMWIFSDNSCLCIHIKLLLLSLWYTQSDTPRVFRFGDFKGTKWPTEPPRSEGKEVNTVLILHCLPWSANSELSEA